jgi:hypothetical protein
MVAATGLRRRKKPRPGSVGGVDAQRALADLVEISPHVEVALVFDADGPVAGAVGVPEGREALLAGTARELVQAAGQTRWGVRLERRLRRRRSGGRARDRRRHLGAVGARSRLLRPEALPRLARGAGGMRRRLLGLSGLAGSLLAGAVVVRRRLEGRRGRVDVHFDDGSFITFVEGSQEADRLLPLARQILALREET